jgi:hypothetical protein
MAVLTSSSFVIPAKAGIQSCRIALGALDPGFRRGDGEENRRVESICDTPAEVRERGLLLYLPATVIPSMRVVGALVA